MSARDAIATCACGGALVWVQTPEWLPGTGPGLEKICRVCGARVTNSGKFIPPGGWALPGVPVHVIVWENGNVMVFDGLGAQVPLLQFTLGSGPAADAVAAEIDRIFARERWEWRIYPGNAKGIATPAWVAGRAAWVNRHFGLPEDAPDGRAVAELEAQDGQLAIGANVTWRAGGMWRYGTGEPDARVQPAGQERERDDPAGAAEPGDARGPVRHGDGAGLRAAGGSDPDPAERAQPGPAQGGLSLSGQRAAHAQSAAQRRRRQRRNAELRRKS